MSYDGVEQSTAQSQAFELYKFAIPGQQTFYLTSADDDVTYLGQLYVASTIRRSEVEHSNEVISGQLKIYVPPDSQIADLLIPYLTPSPMQVTLFGGHYGDSEVVTLFSGKVSSAAIETECEIIVNSDQYILQRKIPKQLYQSPCVHVFGDAGCGINLNDFTTSGLVSAVSADGLTVTVPAFAGLTHSLAGGYFRRGSDVRMILAQAGANITLLSPISGLAGGDPCSGTAGCQLTYAACQSYNNVPNFLGFDLVPLTNPFTEAIV
jgi:uncharacterized phage protein (TIGR02218 family)